MDNTLQTPDDDFDSPAFIVQSPTETMSLADAFHPFTFPLLASRRDVRTPTLASTSSSQLLSTISSPFSTHSVTASPAQDVDQTSNPDQLRCSNSSTSSNTNSRGLSPDYGNRGRDQGQGNSVHNRNLSVDMSSRSSSRRSSFSKPIEVKETLDASVTETADGQLQLKQYMLLKIIGQGAFGIVNLGVDVNTRTHYAIKEFSKSKLRKKDRTNLFKLGPGSVRRRAPAVENQSSPLDLIRGEIAILKKLNHVNIVKLYEVLDVATEDSMFMVHEHGIVHRDIKPDNLLLSADGTLKIVDFGVSEMFTKKGDDLTKKSAGSPAFMAPELCRYDHGEVSGKPTDVWSMGVTLYCIRYGWLPFRCKNPLDLQIAIRENEPEDLEGEEDVRFTNLMRGLLEKDPAKRITIDEIRNDPWLTDDGKEPLLCKEENVENAVTELTDDDLRGAIQRINSLATVNDPWLTDNGKEPLLRKEENVENAVTEVTEDDLRGATQRVNNLSTAFKAISKSKRLLKNPSSRSSSRGFVERISGSSGSEDEHINSSAPSSLASSPELKGDQEKFKGVDDISVLPTQAIGVISNDLLSKVESLGFEDKDKDQSNSKSQAVTTMATSSSGSVSNVLSIITTAPKLQDYEHSLNETADPGPAETVDKESKDQGNPHGEEDKEERYECDWETGICYPVKRR
ncbi:hypothetical protein BGZ58_001012 [Dissophora ornata]|nr:hypothetical protein BGZ58_001012 [Dissophora ornata]